MVQQPIIVLPRDAGTVTGSGAWQAGTPVTNVCEFDHIGVVARSTTTSNFGTIIDIDYGSSFDADFVALLNTNANSTSKANVNFGPTAGGGGGYASGNQTIINPSITSTNGLYHFFWTLPAVQNGRYFRFFINDHGAIPFEIGKIILGKKIQPTYFYEPDFGRGIQDLGGFELGRYGVPSKTPGVIYRTLRFTLGWVTEAEFETQLRPLLELVGTRKPIYICFDPEPTVYRQARTYFGWLREPSFATGAQKPTNMSMEFELVSMI